MTQYRISFINVLANDVGRTFHCCQRSIQIRRAKSRERAIEAAKRRFERLELTADWRRRATRIEVEELARSAP
jgi:hypothetical protein